MTKVSFWGQSWLLNDAWNVGFVGRELPGEYLWEAENHWKNIWNQQTQKSQQAQHAAVNSGVVDLSGVKTQWKIYTRSKKDFESNLLAINQVPYYFLSFTQKKSSLHQRKNKTYSYTFPHCLKQLCNFPIYCQKANNRKYWRK